jgi:hypothetical protein
MKRKNKRLLGLFTLLPFLSILAIATLAIFAGTMHLHFLEAVIAIIAVCTAFLGFGLYIYYLVHAINNKEIDSTEKIMWVILFTFSGFIGVPVYFFTRVNGKSNKHKRNTNSDSDFVDPIIT